MYHHYHPSFVVLLDPPIILVPSIHVALNVQGILQFWIDVDYHLLKISFDIVLHTGGINFQGMLFHKCTITLNLLYRSTFHTMMYALRLYA